jgi:ketosteroid isomerase-like protein
MSRENVEIAKRSVEIFNGRDLVAYDEIYTPDYEWFPAMPGIVAGDSYSGREGVERYFEETSDTWEDLRVVAEEFRDLGDRVLVLGRLAGRGKGSHVQVDSPFGVVIEFCDGRISRVRGYLDHGEALRATGLSE